MVVGSVPCSPLFFGRAVSRPLAFWLSGVDPFKPGCDDEVDKWVWVDRDAGLGEEPSWRDGSTSVLPSGQPGCGLDPVDIVGVGADRSWTSSRGGLCVTREAEGCL
jgi:hypothetical protein